MLVDVVARQRLARDGVQRRDGPAENRVAVHLDIRLLRANRVETR